MFYLSYLPLIAKPTRYTEKTTTLTDHIYTITIYKKVLVGTLVTDLPDHLPVFCITWYSTSVMDTVYQTKLTCQKIDDIKLANLMIN